MTFEVHHGDLIDVLSLLVEDNSIDSCVTDPPYGLRFMGKRWDYDVPSIIQWAEVFRVLKPGSHLLAFSSTRTYHRMVCAIEDAGFEIRDQIAWTYGSGFPKSLNIAKAIEAKFITGGSAPTNLRQLDTGDGYHPHELAGTPGYGDGRMSRGADTDRNYHNAPALTVDEAIKWQGWGTSFKPAWEPICVARKPFIGTVTANVLTHGTGALNIEACRVGYESTPNSATNPLYRVLGRWPANLIHDGSDEVLSCFPQANSARASGNPNNPHRGQNGRGITSIKDWNPGAECHDYRDSGSAARFFYCAKASKSERNAGLPPGIKNKHPTVKPIALMRHLCRAVTQHGGIVLDPFVGSGSTGCAAVQERFSFIGCDIDKESVDISRIRIGAAA